ncbi:MAG: hypothetical protein ACRD8Z_15625 [Nitrososphaeraceae archaeon]
MTQVRLNSQRDIKVRRLIQFSGTTSLGLVVPRNFVDKMGLTAGQYVKCELDKAGNSFSVEKVGVDN